MKRLRRRVGVAVLGCVAGCLQLAAQCPVHPVMPLAETLMQNARVCSKAAQTDSLCSVNHEPETTTAYAMFKDCSPAKPNGFLIVPTEPVTGTEDSRLRAESYAKIWADAWQWAARFPRADAAWTGLASNSQCSRTIDQLHIHASCVSEAVKKRLETERESIPMYKDATSFKEVELPLVAAEGSGVATYRVARLAGLRDVNPTTIVDAMTTHAKPEACEKRKSESMSRQDIAVIGSSVKDEYFVLTYVSGYGNGGAEQLLDQTCKQAEAAGGRQ